MHGVRKRQLGHPYSEEDKSFRITEVFQYSHSPDDRTACLAQFLEIELGKGEK